MKIRDGKKGTQGGFTIIEIMLFIAVSGLLLGVTVFGTYNMIFSSRFTDTISSAASFLQTQYEEARSGVRPVGTTANCGDVSVGAGKSDQVLIGKAIIFGYQDSAQLIRSYYVLGDALAFENQNTVSEINDFDSTDVYTRISAIKPRAVSCGVQSAELAWNAQFTDDGKFVYQDNNGNLISSPPPFNALLLLRNPYSADLRMYPLNIDAFTEVDVSGDRTISNILPDSPSGLLTGSKSALIIKNGDSISFRSLGVVCIDPGSNSTAVYGARDLPVPIDNNGNPDFTKATKSKSEIVSEKCAR
jgi:type II secretory pathway pseudopilin PulG